jgi:hypothetical protein
MDDVEKKLIDQIYELLTDNNIKFPYLNRVEIKLEISCDIKEILKFIPSEKKGYWKNKEGTYEYGGLGNVKLFQNKTNFKSHELFSNIDTILKLSKKKGIKFFGAISFPTNKVIFDSEWSDFGKSVFWLPEIEIIRKNNMYFIACNLFLENNAALRTKRNTIQEFISLVVKQLKHTSVETNSFSNITLNETETLPKKRGLGTNC